MNMTALKPMQSYQLRPAWPDSAAFWPDKRVIVTGSSSFLGCFIGDRDLLETTVHTKGVTAAYAVVAHLYPQPHTSVVEGHQEKARAY